MQIHDHEPPDTTEERRERIEAAAEELRRSDLLDSRMEHWHTQADGTTRASICGILTELAIRAGLPAHWVEQDHTAHEDDTEEPVDGKHLRVVHDHRSDDRFATPAILEEAWTWHGLALGPGGIAGVRTTELNPRIYRPMYAEGCETMEFLPIGLANALLYDAARSTPGPQLSANLEFAQLITAKLDDEDWDGWLPLA